MLSLSIKDSMCDLICDANYCARAAKLRLVTNRCEWCQSSSCIC